jgi:hypothetical protein
MRYLPVHEESSLSTAVQYNDVWRCCHSNVEEDLRQKVSTD